MYRCSVKSAHICVAISYSVFMCVVCTCICCMKCVRHVKLHTCLSVPLSGVRASVWVRVWCVHLLQLPEGKINHHSLCRGQGRTLYPGTPRGHVPKAQTDVPPPRGHWLSNCSLAQGSLQPLEICSRCAEKPAKSFGICLRPQSQQTGLFPA
jgi:hypothetical protein